VEAPGATRATKATPATTATKATPPKMATKATPATKATKATPGSGSPRASAEARSARKKTTPSRAPRPRRARPDDVFSKKIASQDTEQLTVRRMHRRDINRVWTFLKLSFRDVNRETVEYQRPRSKDRFEESYDDEGVEQLVFEVGDEVVGYAECAYEVTGSDNWINPRFFGSRDMRPLFVEELATHPDYQGRGVGSFMMEQLEHLARTRGCTHLVLEVAENNETALAFYRRRSFYKLDAAIFMAKKVDREPDLLPPRDLKPSPDDAPSEAGPPAAGGAGTTAAE
jgi:ribosomal protein S18 acetylase RimI-like enzyme